MRRASTWLTTLCLTAILAGVNTHQALDRYRKFRSGWSWDLAYYNQWFWALTRGDGMLTVRPIGPWAQEGPPLWRMNYLAPIRLAIVPIYRLLPAPTTLLVIQALVFWLVVPAAFGLVRAESGSSALALSAAVLVPMTPLLWPLASNDFRELQLALPFALWAVHGVRDRDVRLTILGVGGLLACRQEFALVVASLAFLPPRSPEDVSTRYRWARALWLTGLGWLLLGFLVYERWAVNSWAWEIFVGEFAIRRPPFSQVLETAGDFLLVGLGSWTLLACLAPRAALLALPWVWSLSSGRWALRYLATEQWHHVRYTVPMVAMVLAAGCLGYARLGLWLSGRRYGPVLLPVVWLAALVGLCSADRILESRLVYVPRPISPTEAAAIWRWIERVGPDDGVIAHYELTAPLSSRRRLFSYVMTQNHPLGYPRLDREIAWAFYRQGDVVPETLTDQGFELVHKGPHILIFHREPGARTSAIADGARTSARQQASLIRGATPSATRSTRSSSVQEVFDDAFGKSMYFLIQLIPTTLFLAPAAALILWARRRVIAARAAGQTDAGISGGQAVAEIREIEGLPVLPIELADGPFCNDYDATAGVLRLSASVADGRSVFGLVMAARAAAQAARHMAGDRRGVLLHPLGFALRLGISAGGVLMLAGVVMCSWSPIETGALVTTASLVGIFPWLYGLERGDARLAETLLDRAGLVRLEDRPLATTALRALPWVHAADLLGGPHDKPLWTSRLDDSQRRQVG